jgi:hypothetical protein
MAAPRTLWSRTLRDGAQVEACLWHDRALAECTVEISVRCARAEDTFATKIADAVRNALDRGEAAKARSESAQETAK